MAVPLGPVTCCALTHHGKLASGIYLECQRRAFIGEKDVALAVESDSARSADLSLHGRLSLLNCLIAPGNVVIVDWANRLRWRPASENGTVPTSSYTGSSGGTEKGPHRG